MIQELKAKTPPTLQVSPIKSSSSYRNNMAGSHRHQSTSRRAKQSAVLEKRNARVYSAWKTLKLLNSQ